MSQQTEERPMHDQHTLESQSTAAFRYERVRRSSSARSCRGDIRPIFPLNQPSYGPRLDLPVVDCTAKQKSSLYRDDG